MLTLAFVMAQIYGITWFRWKLIVYKLIGVKCVFFEDELVLEPEQGYLIYLALPKNCGVYRPSKNDMGASCIYIPGNNLSWRWNVIHLSWHWNVMHE